MSKINWRLAVLQPLFWLLICSLFPRTVHAQMADFGVSAQSNAPMHHDSLSFSEMSLEDLMKVEVTVASKKALTTRESPGIVTLVTEEEIRNSGAQDLMDILRTVPGFDFGVDVEGVVDVAVRGNWAHEGKVLLMIDGMEMNEELYSTLQLGNHYPVDQIKKIEIIRGPGSSIYGGNAEYAVINITTKNDKDFTGVAATASYGQMKDTYARRNVSVMAGQSFGEVRVNLSAFVGEGNRSDQNYTDAYGVGYNMAGQSNLNPGFYNFGLSYKGLSIRSIADMYHTSTRDNYENTMTQAYPLSFNSYFVQAKYDWKASNKITITPSFTYKEQLPWNFNGASVENEFPVYNKEVDKYTGSVIANYDYSHDVNFIVGAESNSVIAENLDTSYSVYSFMNNARNFYVNNYAAFAQGLFLTKIANVTVGARYNYSDRYSPSFVPRIGLTKVFDKFHFKVLYSKAFRTPSVEDINFGNNIKPENTTVAEFETGYQLSANSYLTANIFDITTKDAIIYYTDQNNEDSYSNLGTTGTRGVEVEYKIKGKAGYASINYAFYTASGKNDVDAYKVAGHQEVNTGFPAHEINGSGSIKLNDHIMLNPIITFMSERYYSGVIDSATTGTFKLNPACYGGLFLNFKNLFTYGFNLNIGCDNILNEKVLYIQPYNSNHAPLPGPSREYRIKLSYNLHH